jgi:hypothetical protein
MAIFIKDENYKELSKIFLKDIEDYKQICKVYICTGPNQYELLFDGCADVFCDGTEDGECSDCRVRWLSIYDDLILGTDGPTPEGISKIICPITECASNGLNTTCMDDEVCCKCGVDIFGVPFDPVVCQSLLFPSCPCLKLDSSACKSIPEYITNTCQAYAYAALTGELGSEENCKSCIDPTQTEIGKCCKFGRKYTYIKNATWNNNPDIESNCGIRRNCEAFNFLTTTNPELKPFILDFGYGLSAENLVLEGGIAGGGPGDPTILCPDNQDIESPYLCSCFPFCCQEYCNSSCSTLDVCRRMCDINNECSKFNSLYQSIYNVDFDTFKCAFCGELEEDPCKCNEPPPPEGCDICVDDPCSDRCIVDCEGSVDWCGSFCIGTEINWPCLWNSSAGLLTVPEILTILRNLNCPCAPDFDTCNDICYDYFGTDQVG